jgi:uncharacterized Zn-binding protein involved in type VI secretion
MDKAATRLGDKSIGERGFPPRPVIEGSDDIFINNKPAVRVGDTWLVHCLGTSCHDAISRTGAPAVYFNSKKAVRVTDRLSDNDTVAEGSNNVFIGDLSMTPSPGPRTWEQMTFPWVETTTPWRDA